MVRTMAALDPIARAERAIERASAALIEACEALQEAKTARTRQPARRSTTAHRLATAIAVETAPGLPLDSAQCRRVYIAAYEAYTSAQRAGQTPARAKLAAYSAAESTQENLL